jgi:hypothetical protein
LRNSFRRRIEKLSSKCKFISSKLCSIKRLAERKVNFRDLQTFKTALFSSSDVVETNKLPVSAFYRIMKESESLEIKNNLGGAAEMIINAIADEEGLIDLIGFADIVDLFVYFPVHLKNMDKYKSEEIHKVMQYQAGLVKVKSNELKD